MSVGKKEKNSVVKATLVHVCLSVCLYVCLSVCVCASVLVFQLSAFASSRFGFAEKSKAVLQKGEKEAIGLKTIEFPKRLVA